MARFDFSLEEIEVSDNDFTPVEPGEYTLRCTEAEEKDTKAGTGSYIAATFVIVGPVNKGRKIWHNFNINNPSVKAQDIGRQQLAGWARAAGKPNAKDTDELLERKFEARIDTEAGNAGYADKSVIKAFLSPTPAGEVKKPASAKDTASASESNVPVEESAPPPKAAPKPAAKPTGTKVKAPWDD